MSKKSSTFAIKKTMNDKEFLMNVFISLLEKCDCKQSFVANMLEQLEEQASWKYIKNLDPDAWVLGGFIWSKTAQGIAYWKNIDDIWHLILLAYRTNTND